MLHQGLKAKLTMTLENPTSPARRQVLRAFKTQIFVTVAGMPEPVFLISVTPEAPKTRFQLYSIPMTLAATSDDTKQAEAALSAIPDTRIIAQTNETDKTARVFLAKP